MRELKKYKKKFHPAQIILLIFIVTFGLISGNILPKIKTTKAAPCILNSTGNNCENQDAVINATTVTISGKHTFNSLTIENGGILTHAALQYDIDVDENNKITPSGENKKIDLVIVNDLNLVSGGSINADGKGYPAGRPPRFSGDSVRENGYGTGSGKGTLSTDFDGYEPAGGGAGFGGKGGVGVGRQIPEIAEGGTIYRENFIPLATYDYEKQPFGNDNSNVFYGSGGGMGILWYGTTSPIYPQAGAGGGSIRIKIIQGQLTIDRSSGSKISANGGSGYCVNLLHSKFPCGGGGSGGFIWIQTLKTFNDGDPDVSRGETDWLNCPDQYNEGGTYHCRDYFGLRYGENGYLYTKDFKSSAISAKGGNTYMKQTDGTCGAECKHAGGTGGGGQIIIAPYPTVDIDANTSDGPIDVLISQIFNLSWTSTNSSNYCKTFGQWGTHDYSSIFNINKREDIAGNYTYGMRCYGYGELVEDSVIVNVLLSITHSNAVTVTVTWMEGAREEKVELKTFFKNIQ